MDVGSGPFRCGFELDSFELVDELEGFEPCHSVRNRAETGRPNRVLGESG